MKPTYEMGLEEGRGQAIEAVNAIMEPRGGECWMNGNEVYIRLQGNTFKTSLT